MISILIPTYNKVCLPLVQEIYSQASRLQIPFEVLVMDDGSIKEVKERNQKINFIDNCQYILLKENVGPARIRNILADKAKFPYLLFMDSDTIPSTENFLKEYLENKIEDGVVCGGFIYERTKTPAMCQLRYKYGIKVEESSAEQRNKQPYNKFISMCFLASKTIFKSIRFDDSMHFGYEDAWFGILLQKHAVPVLHIDNPVYHQTTDEATVYLHKIRISIQNLINHREKMNTHIRLLQWLNKIEKLHLSGLVGFIFKLSEPILVSNLTGRHPSMNLFAFYKLGYLCHSLQHRKQQN